MTLTHITGTVLTGLLLVLANRSPAQPIPLRSDISIKKVLSPETDCVRIARDPSTGKVYYLRGNGDIDEVNIAAGTKSVAYTSANHKLNFTASGGGFAISKDGAFFIVGYPVSGTAGYNIGVVERGHLQNTTRVWDTVAITEPYLQSLTGHDHLFNAIEIMPGENYLIVNSGSRTDHGDTARVLNGGREYPITSAMFMLPFTGKNIHLWNNEDSLKPYLYADGVRNAFDMAFAPNGDLFAIDNSDVADDDEELNWIREGRHYGFPWRISTNDNPQQYPGFSPASYFLLNTTDKSFFNDLKFPLKPAGVTFTDPIMNIGPDDDHFRDTNRTVKDASALGRKLSTFSSHSSPLALVFDSDSALIPELAGHLFAMSYNDNGQAKFIPMAEPGQDLLHLELTKIDAEDRYEVKTTRIAQGFTHPVDAIMIKNKLYVVENGVGASLWEVTLPAKAALVRQEGNPPSQFQLGNYPNPFNPATTIRFSLPRAQRVTLKVFDMIGREVATLLNDRLEPGQFEVAFNAAGLSSGVYVYRLQAGDFGTAKSMVLLK